MWFVHFKWKTNLMQKFWTRWSLSDSSIVMSICYIVVKYVFWSSILIYSYSIPESLLAYNVVLTEILIDFNAIQPLRERNLEQIRIAIDSTKSAACRNVNPMYYNNCMRIELLWKSPCSFHADRAICLLRDYGFVFIADCNWYCQILFSRIQPNS